MSNYYKCSACVYVGHDKIWESPCRECVIGSCFRPNKWVDAHWDREEDKKKYGDRKLF